MSSSHTPATRRILALFEKYGETDYIGEPLSVLEHSIQAAQAAKAFDEKDSELMIAALLVRICCAQNMMNCSYTFSCIDSTLIFLCSFNHFVYHVRITRVISYDPR
jgi:predicted HD phosphohydrolase